MDDRLRQRLCDIVASHGPGIADDAARCAVLLRSDAEADGPGLLALLKALEARVPARLTLLTEARSLAPVASGLARRLVEEHGLSDESARWAVDSSAEALGRKDEEPVLPALFDRPLSGPPTRRHWLLWAGAAILAAGAGAGAWWWYGQRSEVGRLAVDADGFNSLGLSADGKVFAVGCGDKTVRLIDVESLSVLTILPGHEEAPVAAISPDGRRVLSGSGSVQKRDSRFQPIGCEVRLWDADTSQLIRRLGQPVVPQRAVAFSPDGSRAAAGGGGDEYREAEFLKKEGKPIPFECVLRVFDVVTGEPVARMEGHKGVVLCAAFTPDGRYVVSGSADATVRLWDVETGRELRRLETASKGAVACLAISRDGRRLLYGDAATRMRLADLESGAIEREWVAHSEWVRSVAFSADETKALSGGDDYAVRLWDLESGAELRHFKGHTRWVTGVAFLPDGRRRLSVAADGTARIWRLPE